MKNKYYQPKSEEFFEGFCFEQLIGISTNSNELWVKSVFSLEDNTKTPIQNLLNENKIRVKHLDREDIESLGWVYDGRDYYQLGEHTLWVNEKIIKIEVLGDYDFEESGFQGTILNKSRLKLVMEMLNIEKK